MQLPLMPPVAPMLAKPAKEIPPGQFYEPKWDGFRAIVFRDGDEVVIGSRKERPLTRYFPEVVEAVRRSFPPRAVIDGEIVIVGDRGLDFWALQQRIHPAASRVTPITRDESIAGAWFERFEGAGLDGLIAKRADLTYQPDKRVMTKIKHVRTADCVVAGYRVHKSAPDTIGSLLLGLHVDAAAPPSPWMDHFEGLAPVGVIGAFPMARRRELFTELQPLVIDFSEHPWSWAAERGRAPEGGSRWNPKKDLSFTPLRPVRVVEVRYDYLEGARFRHPPQFVRWRPERDASSCGFAQLEQPAAFDLADILSARPQESV